jgi:hypothetical protein
VKAGCDEVKILLIVGHANIGSNPCHTGIHWQNHKKISCYVRIQPSSLVHNTIDFHFGGSCFDIKLKTLIFFLGLQMNA